MRTTPAERTCFTCINRPGCKFYANLEPFLLLCCDSIHKLIGDKCKSYKSLYVTVLKKNSITCRVCRTTIESRHVHDFVTCECGAVSVDGGHDYMKMSGNPDNIIDNSEWVYLTPDEYKKVVEDKKKRVKNLSDYDVDFLLEVFNRDWTMTKRIDKRVGYGNNI